jgi:hypothetical protein
LYQVIVLASPYKTQGFYEPDLVIATAPNRVKQY